MPREIKAGSTEEQVLRVLRERYPITLPEVALALRQRADSVKLAVRRLVAQGLVVREEVGGETFVALSGAGYRFVGMSAADVARLKKASKLPPTKPRDEHDPAFM